MKNINFSVLFEVGLVIIGIAASCYAFYPGCMSGDPNFSWGEALNNPTLQFHNWHPPLVAYLWRLLNQLPFDFKPRYTSLFIAMNLLYWVGLVLAIRPWIHCKLLWIIFFLYVGFFPPSFGILSQPIKDSLMCAALMAAYGGLLAADRQRSKIAFGFGLFCLFLALGFRHNALFAVFPLAVWAGFIACRHISGCPWWKKTMAGIVIFIALLGTISGVNSLITAQSSYPIQSIYSFDLVGISALTGHVYLPELYNDKKPSTLKNFFAVKGAQIEGNPLSIENIRLLYSPNSNLNIYFYGPGKGLRFLDNDEEVATLRQAWLNAIFQEPISYLKVRADLYSALIGLHHSENWPYFCMTAGNPDTHMTMPRFYLSIKNSWFFKGISYIVLLACLLAGACWKKHLFPPHIIALGASGLMYGASYFIVGVSNDFRYLFWIIPACLIMAINMAFIELTRK